MTVVLSMKTFQKLEEKLGTEAAKEVYQLAEAIYEEVEKKCKESMNDYQLRIKDSGENVANKADFSEFKKELNTTLITLFEERIGDLKTSQLKFRKALNNLTGLLIMNSVILLLIIGYFLRTM